MAFELPLILGLRPTTSSTILNGFLQQNVLFDAFSDNIVDPGAAAFLFDLANIFAMIGLLVLVFSPSLWKSKYIVSWIFLFFCIILGGATGPEMGYNFSGHPDMSYLNQPLDNDSLGCSNSELRRAYCEKELSGDATLSKVANEVGRPKQKAGSAAAQGKSASTKTAQGNVRISIDSETNNIKDLSIIGFFPHVLILYVTNKLRLSLEYALYDLGEKSLKKKMSIIKIMSQAKIPNPQLDIWTNAFDKLCGPSVKATYNGMGTANFLSKVASGDLNDMSLAKLNKEFTVDELTSVIKTSNLIQRSDPLRKAPALIDINNPALRDDIYHVTPQYLRYYTINAPKEGEMAPQDFNAMDVDNLVFNMQTSIQSREGRDSENYEDELEYFSSNYGRKQANLLLVRPLTKNSAYAATEVESKSIQFKEYAEQKSEDRKELTKKFNYALGAVGAGINFLTDLIGDDVKENINKLAKTQKNFVSIPNCQKFAIEYGNYYRDSLNVDMSDLEEQFRIFLSNSGKDICQGKSKENKPECENYKAGMLKMLRENRGLSALKERVNLKDLINKQCQAENIADKDRAVCQKEFEKYQKIYAVSSINNSMSSYMRALSQQYSSRGELESGGTGIIFKTAEKFTEAFAPLAAGFASLFSGAKAGMYSAILPIIKNILTAFVLIMTPILFVIGLMVPAWAPGVILTSLVALAYLQMVDVVMVLMIYILTSIHKTLTSSESAATYEAFMEALWALAYMASFGITAFFMFAAGNTKAIMSKITGADGTINKIGGDVASTGVKAIQVGAMVGTGGAVAIGAGKQLMDKVTDVSSGISSTAAGMGGDNFKFGAPIVAMHRQKTNESIEKFEKDNVESQKPGLAYRTQDDVKSDRANIIKNNGVEYAKNLSKTRGYSGGFRDSVTYRHNGVNYTAYSFTDAVGGGFGRNAADMDLEDNVAYAAINSSLKRGRLKLHQGKDIKDISDLNKETNMFDEKGNSIVTKEAKTLNEYDKYYSMTKKDFENSIEEIKGSSSANRYEAEELLRSKFTHSYIKRENGEDVKYMAAPFINEDHSKRLQDNAARNGKFKSQSENSAKPATRKNPKKPPRMGKSAVPGRRGRK